MDVSTTVHRNNGVNGSSTTVQIVPYNRSPKFCPECHAAERSNFSNSHSRVMTPSSSYNNFPNSPTASNGKLPPVQKAIVKTFSIDKLRPVCPVCNPVGDVPYPKDALIVNSPPKMPRNNNFSDEDDNAEEEVRKLNSELEELQKRLLNGAADLAQVIDDSNEDTKL